MDKRYRIIRGDAIENMKNMPDESVDLIVTDPPYNLKKDYLSSKDNMEFDEYIEWSRKWLKEAHRILKPEGTIYVFMGMRFISYLYNIMEQELNFRFNSWITWHYTQGIGKTKGFSPRHDDILMFTKSKKFTFNLDDIRIPQKYYRSVNNMRGANPGNVWKVSHVHYSEAGRTVHPTQKPEALYERMILASSNEGDVVLDPFVGTGTALKVAEHTNRKSIGIELEPSFIEIIEKRLSEPFKSFDSMDKRIERVPNDLNNRDIRMEYFKNHIEWFLNNHSNSIENFISNFIKKYENKIDSEEMEYILSHSKELSPSDSKQLTLF